MWRVALLSIFAHAMVILSGSRIKVNPEGAISYCSVETNNKTCAPSMIFFAAGFTWKNRQCHRFLNDKTLESGTGLEHFFGGLSSWCLVHYDNRKSPRLEAGLVRARVDDHPEPGQRPSEGDTSETRPRGLESLNAAYLGIVVVSSEVLMRHEVARTR